MFIFERLSLMALSTSFASFQRESAYVDLRCSYLPVTSASMWTNLPVAFVILLLLRRLSFNYEIRWSPDYHPDCCIHNRRPVVHQLAPDGPLLSWDLEKHPKRQGSWRAGISAPAVEAAVDALTKAIVREWVTNLWYRLVTPDEVSFSLFYLFRLEKLVTPPLSEVPFVLANGQSAKDWFCLSAVLYCQIVFSQFNRFSLRLIPNRHG